MRLLAGAAATTVAVLAAAVVLWTQTDRSQPQTPQTAASSSTTPTASAETATSTALGLIEDVRADLVYPRLAAPWTPIGQEWKQSFTAGQIAAVQAPTNGASFNALCVSGVPRTNETQGYTRQDGLRTVAARVKTRILNELFTVLHTQTALASGPSSRPRAAAAWTERFRLDFPDARANGWQVTSITAALLLTDPGTGRLGLLLVAIPNSFTTPGDLDTLLSSTRSI
ncbi:hypothetical protein [Actinocorallia populi]|uniref:hypothetical protein n=1 Tax=Actinocorallia populi TaxID=2079200 RepID=UPI001E33406B|nr:hypothetical protein [Actinocorallia populi]